MSSKKAAILLGCSDRHIYRMCINGKLPGAIKVDGHWNIPPSAHPKLAGIKGSEDLTSPAELLNVPVHKRDKAVRRLGIIQAFEKFAAAHIRNNGTRTEALAIFVVQNRIGERSLKRWISKYRNQGLLGLVDTRGGSKFLSRLISPEAFELFKSMYLTQQQLSVKTCWQNICFVNKDQQHRWKIPGMPFMYKYIKDQIPLPVQVLHREGLAAYEAKCAPYIQIDPDSVQPGQVSVGDHSQFNCWIRHRGRWIRPWLTAWEDMRSRMIVGRHISALPNQTTILLAMKQAIEKYGPSDSVKIDNGRDYDSEMWTGTTKTKRRILKKGYIDEQMVAGIYAMMGIGISFSIKYHPQSKPIERWFDTLDCQFTKTIPTYCGKDTERKPEELKKLLNSDKVISDAYDLESFTGLIDQYIEVYNNSVHTGRGMDGRTPAEVMATRTSRRVMIDGVLDLLLRVWSGELIVGKNGVRFKEIWYGQYDMDLAVHQGKKVRVAYDPNDLRQVYVYDAATLRLITIAEQAQLIRYGSAVNEEHLRLAMQQKSQARRFARGFRDSRLVANMNLTDLTIKAMQEGRKAEQKPQKQTTLRPVKTPMDGQVREHARKEIFKKVRKAAGAESIETVLDFDFSLLKKQHKKTDLKMFDE